MKSFMLVCVASAMAAMAGCVSIEETRAQLQSNDPTQVKLAEENILKVVSSQALSADLPEKYVELVDDNELLGKIMASTQRSEVLGAALNKLDPSKPGAPNDLLLQMMEQYRDESVCAMISKKIDLTQPGIGMKILTRHAGILPKVNRAESHGGSGRTGSAPIPVCFADKVIASLSEGELSQAMKMDMNIAEYNMYERIEVRKQIAKRLASVTTDVELLLSFYDGDLRGRIDYKDREEVVVKLATLSDKINNREVIVKLLKAGKNDCGIKDLNLRAKLISRLSEADAVKYALDAVNDHGVHSWNSDEMSPLNDAIAITKVAKNPEDIAKIVSAVLGKIILHRKACKDSWSMSWTQKDEEKANALVKSFPKLNDATIIALICADSMSWRYIIDSVSADVAYNVLTDGKAKSAAQELALLNKLPKDRIDMKVYNGVRYDDTKKAVNASMPQALKQHAAEAEAKAFASIVEKAKDAAKDTFELGGFYLGMSFEDMKIVFAHHFPEWQIKEAVDGEGKDADYVIYVPGQSSPFCYADAGNKKVYQFNFGKKILKKWYKYDVQTFMEWANAYERETKIDMKYKLIEKDATVYAPDMSDSYNVWFHQESYQYKHNTKEYRLIYFGEQKDYTFHGGIGGALIKEMAAPKFRYVRGDPGSLRVRFERD